MCWTRSSPAGLRRMGSAADSCLWDPGGSGEGWDVAAKTTAPEGEALATARAADLEDRAAEAALEETEEYRTAKRVGFIGRRLEEVIEMPGFDRTGPLGMGPRTGGGFGLCRPRSAREATGPSPYPMRGAGRGFAPWGGGRGRVWGGGRGAGGWGRGRGGGFGAGRGGFGAGRGGFGAGRGGFRGFPRFAGYPMAYEAPSGYPDPYEAPSREDELQYLRDVRKDMETEMQALQGRIKELETRDER